ncbi:putative bifunctional diguanylate cyclase/phosphodiesterase [Lysinibacillus sp. LZ02]|uniref:putative bifunctional diguanylate cyclase/phosphodiesterase n=1 Tax=Lysinibacillus sp. LZ02 TaxID=3420668 RepID=UPI003D36AC0A
MNRAEEKAFMWRHIRNFLIVSVVCLFLFLNYPIIYHIIGESNLASLTITIQMFMLVAIVSVGIQIWFSTRFNLDNKNVHMGALFFTIGLFQVVHIISFTGMPNYLYYNYGEFSILFDLIIRNLLPFGMIVISFMRAKDITMRYRRMIFAASITIALAFIVGCFSYVASIHTLFDQFNLKVILQTTALTLQVILLCLLIKDIRMLHRKSFFFFIGTLYFMMGNVLFTLSTSHADAYYIVGELMQVCSFITLFYAIYYSSVERPYKDLALSEMRMQKMAYYDEVVGLPNQRYLEEKLEKELPIAKKQQVILLIEVERLDAIKISLGQKSTNELMCSLADRFQRALTAQQELMKFGKNQFVIYVQHFQQEEVDRICERVRRSLEPPIQIKHYSLRMKFHTGVAIYPNDANHPEGLIQCAHLALNKAKHSIAGYPQFYTADMEMKNREQIQLEHDLEKAVLNEELFLEYQPQLDVRTREICSVEALVRWQHPTMGRIPPNRFIPIAEESGLIIPMGLAILKMACNEMKRWQQLHDRPIKLAVNLSLSQLYQENFIDEIRKVLVETQFDPNYLQLEITESMTFEATQLISILSELKKMGIGIAIDDFGTGYSSLAYLADFPFDCLKIDRSFVNKIGISAKGEAIVTTILAMAEHLHVEVVAEGIETMEQFKYLEKVGCNKIQGYYVGKPIPFHQFVNDYKSIVTRAYSII